MGESQVVECLGQKVPIELAALAMINTKNVIQVYDYFDQDNSFVIITEFFGNYWDNTHKLDEFGDVLESTCDLAACLNFSILN